MASRSHRASRLAATGTWPTLRSRPAAAGAQGRIRQPKDGRVAVAKSGCSRRAPPATRRRLRRAVAIIAATALLMHGAGWPLAALAQALGAPAVSFAGTTNQVIEICASHGTKRVLVATPEPRNAPGSSQPCDGNCCASCVCTTGACGGLVCPGGDDVAFAAPTTRANPPAHRPIPRIVRAATYFARAPPTV